MRKLFLKKFFSSKCSLELSDSSFHNHSEKKSPVGQTISSEIPKKIKLVLFFLKNFGTFENCSSIKVGCSFDNPAKNVSIKGRRFLMEFRNSKNMFLSQLKLFFKTFLRGRRMQFWQSCQYFFARILKFFSWKAEIEKKITISSNKKFFFPKNFFGHVKWRFGNRSKEFKLKDKQLSPQMDEMLKKHIIHSISTQYFLWTRRKHFWQPWHFFFCHTSHNFCWKSKSDTKNRVSAKKTLFSSKVPLCT